METSARDPVSNGAPQAAAGISPSGKEATGEAPHRDSKDVEVAGQASTRPSVMRRWRDEVNMTRVDVVVILCALMSGFTDSTMFDAYSTFVSMQTGNTIFIALGASGQSPTPYSWAKSLMAVVCFVLGSFFFSRLARRLGGRRRISLVASFALQGLLVLVAAALTQSGAVGGSVPPLSALEIDWASLAPIALLSFQSAGQIVEARNLGINEVPTVVITSLLCDLFSDPAIFDPLSKNVKRNRRVTAFVLTLLGGIAGGWVSRRTGGVAASLWVVFAMKIAIAVAWSFWPPQPAKVS